MTVRVFVRPPRLEDRVTFLAAAKRSRALHGSWVSPPDTPARFQKYLRRISSDEHCGFVVVHRQTGALVGVVNLNHIIRSSLRSVFLGYFAFADYAGQGLMREGLSLVLAHAFKVLKLHRLEANIQPGNKDSLALARRLGFVREGYSRRYLKIGGRWRDHERWAILVEDWRRRA